MPIISMVMMMMECKIITSPRQPLTQTSKVADYWAKEVMGVNNMALNNYQWVT